MFDIFIHVPIDLESEAFGLIYIEALAAGIPSIFTLSGVAPEFIQHELNALVVPHCSSTQITEQMNNLLKNNELRNKIIVEGQKIVAEKFNKDQMIASLKVIYEQ